MHVYNSFWIKWRAAMLCASALGFLRRSSMPNQCKSRPPKITGFPVLNCEIHWTSLNQMVTRKLSCSFRLSMWNWLTLLETVWWNCYVNSNYQKDAIPMNLVTFSQLRWPSHASVEWPCEATSKTKRPVGHGDVERTTTSRCGPKGNFVGATDLGWLPYVP